MTLVWVGGDSATAGQHMYYICHPHLQPTPWKCLKYSASATHPLLRKVSNIPNFLGTLCVPASAHCLVRKRSVKSWSSNPDSRSIHLRTHDNDEDDGAKDVGVGDAEDEDENNNDDVKDEDENNNDDVEVQAVCALFGSTRPLWTGHDQSVRRHDDDSNDGENF